MNPYNFNQCSFNEVADIYQEVRPGYGQDIYRLIDLIKPFDHQSKILEIGCGTGIATKEIAHFWPSEVTALEPGEQLVSIAKKSLSDCSNVQIECDTFEAFESQMQYDGIFSATAFHWIDPNIKYKKAYSLLKEDGILALYWNNYLIKDEVIRNAVDEVYIKHNVCMYDKPIIDVQKDKIQSRTHEIEHSGYFKLRCHQLFHSTFGFSSERYIKLLQTFSNHSKETIPDIDIFFQEIKNIIIENDNVIELSVTTNLELAEKKK